MIHALQQRLRDLPEAETHYPAADLRVSASSQQMAHMLAAAHESLREQDALVPRSNESLSIPAQLGAPVRRVTHVPTLKKQKRFPIASIDFSRSDIGLPYGTPRRVNAATLKALAGGTRVDQLLKKTTAGWEFVNDDTMVDLSDRSIEFRLGRLTIFS